jgi:flavin reductase
MPHLNSFKLAMRRLAGGVCLVTGVEKGVPLGLVATAVTSFTADPPTLISCINKSASAHDGILRAGSFCINVLDEEDSDLARRFSSPELRASRFDDNRWTVLETGSPVLRGALASFDCTVADTLAYGTHTLFIGQVISLVVGDGLPRPLVYLDGQYARLRAAATKITGSSHAA